MRALIAVAAIALAPGLARAESFDVLSWNKDRLVAVDKDSLSDASGIKRIRIAVIYAQPRGEGAGAFRGTIGLQEFDCAQGRFHTLESAPFDDAGSPISALATKDATAWTAIAPGTLAADERGRVCDSAWPGGAYRTKLPILIGAYLLRPEPSDVRIAGAPQGAASDAVAITPR